MTQLAQTAASVEYKTCMQASRQRQADRHLLRKGTGSIPPGPGICRQIGAHTTRNQAGVVALAERRVQVRVRAHLHLHLHLHPHLHLHLHLQTQTQKLKVKPKPKHA